MSAATRSPLRSLRSLRGERATPLRVNSKPDTLCALKPDTSICPQHWLSDSGRNARHQRGFPHGMVTNSRICDAVVAAGDSQKNIKNSLQSPAKECLRNKKPPLAATVPSLHRTMPNPEISGCATWCRHTTRQHLNCSTVTSACRLAVCIARLRICCPTLLAACWTWAQAAGGMPPGLRSEDTTWWPSSLQPTCARQAVDATNLRGFAGLMIGFRRWRRCCEPSPLSISSG